MAKQLYYENVELGFELPTLVKHPTTRQLVKWACLMEEFYELHYDKDFAISQGLPGIPVQGPLLLSFLGQMLTDWIGEQGIIRKLNCSFRGIVLPSEDVICRGKVSGKYIQDGERCVECEIWTENAKGERTVVGKAVIVLPD